MLNNHFRLIFRTLWRKRLFTALNVLGLSVGIASAWIVFQIVYFENSYDAQHPNLDRIYRVSSLFTIDGKESGNAGVPLALAGAAKDIAGVELAVPVFDKYVSNVAVPVAGGAPVVFEDEFAYDMVESDGRYFRLTPYTWLAGNPQSALDAPGQVVLTRSRAAKYFPGLDAKQVIGQVFYHNDTVRVTVSGVVADLDYPSVFRAKEIHSFAKPSEANQRWVGVSSNNQLFLQLGEHVQPDRILEQINRISDEKSREELSKYDYSYTRKHLLQSLKSVHFEPKFASLVPTTNPRILYGMSIIAAFLLLLAVINYINLATAQLPQRTREIGVRKTLGGRNGGIVLQFLNETAVVTFISLLLATVLGTWFLHHFQELIPSEKEFLSFIRVGPMLGFAALLLLSVSVMSGLYPGWLMSRFQPAGLLRGQVTHTWKNGAQLRKGLIVFQFAVAQSLLIVALVVGQQMQFLMRQDLGFDREAVVIVDIPWKVLKQPEMKGRHFILADAYRKIPEIADITLGEQLFSGSSSSNGHQAVNEKGEIVKHELYTRGVDTAALRFYKMPLLAGRNLAPSDTVKEYVLNETAVREFGFASPEAAVGQSLKEEGGDKSFPIVGVVHDFHMGSAYDKIQPIALNCSREGQSTLSIKLAGADPAGWQTAFQKMDAEWQKLYPGAAFKYQFYDEVLAEMYEDDRKISTMANGTMAVALLISCLGLFGLSTYTVLRRTKEIGIRKVLGASVQGIANLLVRDFLLLVLVAVFIAAPVAYYFVQKWLADFAYCIDLEWWMFAAACSGALALAFFTVSFQSIKAALANPVKSLRSE